MRGLLGILLLSFITGPVFSGEMLDLSSLNGWTIVVAEDAIQSEKYAAGEFKVLFKKATGIDLPLKSQAPNENQNVFIGPGDDMRQSSAGFTLFDLGEEDLRINIRPQNIAIAGGRPRGTLYGVYEFMERYLDVRFLTTDHTYVPPQKWKISFLVPCERYTYRPPFSFRWPYYSANADHHEFAARLRVNTTPTEDQYGGKTGQQLINHSFHHFMPVEKYGKEHPEYFALVDGERKLEMGGGGPELCVTNPEVIEIVAENVIKDLDAQPNRTNISVSQNDNAAYCRCDKCEAINQREGTPMGSHLAFVNAVAERVEKKHPDVKIGTLSYWYTRKPPKTIKPRENVQIQLCSIECCTLHPINDPNCPKNREFCKDMEEWGKICDDIWVWNYNTNFSFYDLPFPNLRSISDNVKYFLTNNAKGLFMQANGNGHSGEMSDLRNYVIARCIWNPTLDSWDLVEEFCQLHYQSAAQPILEYLTMLHDNAEASGYHPNCFPRPYEVGLRPEISLKAMEYFQKALNLANSEAVKQRVEKASICAYRAIIETCSELAMQDGNAVLQFPKPHEGIIKQYKALCHKYNMDRAAERLLAEGYFQRLDNLTQKGQPAQRIENPYWRLTCLPDRNGRLVEIYFKPQKHDFLLDFRRAGISTFSDIGFMQETGVQGYQHANPSLFNVHKDDATLVLDKRLSDDSRIVRQIKLIPDATMKIRFTTTINHSGSDPKTYQFKVEPQFDTQLASEDWNVLSAYVKDDQWQLFNQNWRDGDGPNHDLLNKAKGGAVAFFNHKNNFGLLQRYDPQQFESPYLWWRHNRPQMNLGLITKAIELKKGESFTYSYEYEYIDEAPK